MATTGPHVLVIDDATELRQLFRDALEGEGYRVSLAAAPPALDEIARLRPDLVLLDLLLGEDEGVAWRLVQGLRRDPRLAAVPILVCSAATHLLRRLELELRGLGVVVVTKPFDLDDFLATVDRCAGGGCGEIRHGAEPRP